MNKNKNRDGFTIVELLIVIVVIAVLAAITVVAFNGIQARSQDSKRAQDLSNIVKALRSYEATYGGVPVTWAYAGNGDGGWNNSTMTNWLTFLEATHGPMPRDTVNSLAGDGYPDTAGERAYYYYCYPSSSAVQPNSPTVRVGYRTERNDTIIARWLLVDSCLTSLPT